MSALPTGKPYGRLADFPLDPTCVHESNTAASVYAASSPLAYAGQIISVTDPPGVFMIRGDRTLLPLFGGSVSGVSVLAEPMFPIGYITWIGADTDIPACWVPGDTGFSPLQFPLLAAWLGTTRTPTIPSPDGLRGIMLGKYVDTVRIPDTGFVEIAGPSQELQHQLVAASNALIAQLRFEDSLRRQLVDTVGEPCLLSDDWTMLVSRMQYLTQKFRNVLMNQGVSDAETLKADALIDQVDRLALSVFRLTTFATDAATLLVEKNANIMLPGFTLSWTYSDDALLKSQSLTGPGVTVIETGSRSLYVVPDRKDIDLDYRLSATSVSNTTVSRSLCIEYVHPVYYGCSPMFEIDETIIKAGTKLLERETPCRILYEPVDGYMFFAVPETWHPYGVAVDSHGFDFLSDSLRVFRIPVTSPDGTQVPYRVYASRICNHLDHYTLHFRY